MKNVNFRDFLVKNDININIFIDDCDDLESLSYDAPDLWVYNSFGWDNSNQYNYDFWFNINDKWTQEIKESNIDIEFGMDSYIEPYVVEFEELV